MALKDLGVVTAYAYAVANGYTGTEEEFEIAMGNLPDAVDSVEAAVAIINGLDATVTTGAAGTNASVNYNKVTNKLEFTIPRGDTGEISQEFVDEHLAYNDGYYDSLTAGSAEQLISNIMEEDTKPYVYRTTGGNLDVGDRKTEELVGGTIAWNQLAKVTSTDTEFNGITYDFDSSKGTVSIGGLSTARSNVNVASGYYIPFNKTHKYFVSLGADGGTISGYHGSLVFYNGNTYAAYREFTARDGVYSFDITATRFIYEAIGAGSAGVTIQPVTLIPQVFDLTQMFGSTVADAIYAMEQAEAGTGVAWFRKYFPKSYYAYDAGSLQSVNVAAGVNTGFNQWDEEWEVGDINSTNGVNQTGNFVRSKNYIPVIANAVYFWKGPSGSLGRVFYYDEDKNFISYATTTAAKFTPPSNCRYIKFRMGSSYGATYNHDICINISWDGSRDGEYEPYDAHVYNYDSDLQLRGIPSLDEFGNLQYDGDIYKPDGTVTRSFVQVVLNGTEEWQKRTSSNPDCAYYALKVGAVGIIENGWIISDKYLQTNIRDGNTDVGIDVINSNGWNGSFIYIRPENTGSTAIADFKENLASNPVTAVYKVTTPTTEQADPFTSPQVINDFGTEEWIDAGVQAGTRDVTIPVGHNSAYMVNLKAKLEMAPNSPDGDGEYLVRQRNGENEYVPFTWAGDHLDLTAGSAHQLISTVQENDQSPYLFRTSGGSVDIGDREFINGIVGGTMAWNQLVQNGNFVDSTGWQANAVFGTGVFTNNKCIYTITSKNASQSVYSPTAYTEPVIKDHKYLVSAKVKCSEATTSLRMEIDPAFGKYFSLNANTETNIATIVNAAVSRHTGFYIYPKLSSGLEVGATFEVSNVMRIDLTQMFGSVIADYVYSLEQATAGAGVAWFKKLFPKPYYAYNAGELLSVSGLQSHDMTGFNQWDEEDFRGGVYIGSNPESLNNSSDYATLGWTQKIEVASNASYYVSVNGSASSKYYVFYDEDKNRISDRIYTNANNLISVPDNARFMSISVPYTSSTYNHDICINLHWDGSRNGEYEPYELHSYPLDSDLTLRGIPKLDANNNLYYDGDVYEPDGTVTRKYGIVDLGTLTWSYDSSLAVFYSTDIVNLVQKPLQGTTPYRCDRYFSYPSIARTVLSQIAPDRSIIITSSGALKNIAIKDSSYSDTTAFKAAMSGVYLVYELATPTTEEADPYQTPQIVNDFGTEEFVIDSEIAVPIPVGHDTDYPINLVAKLEMVPNSPDGDGDYIVRQVNGENEYVPLVIPSELPPMPTANGTYKLIVTVANGTPTLAWEAQS